MSSCGLSRVNTSCLTAAVQKLAEEYEEYVVSPRTVISRNEKACERGLLSLPPKQGPAGGRLVLKGGNR